MATIILIEEEDLLRKTMVQILEMMGFEVIQFPDTALALNNSLLRQADLILMDLGFPTYGMNFIREVRKRNLTMPILVTVLHLYPGSRQVEDLKELGAQEVVGKPVAAGYLEEILLRLLRESHGELIEV